MFRLSDANDKSSWTHFILQTRLSLLQPALQQMITQRSSQEMQKAGSCSAAASELELCELPKHLRLGMRQQDTWNLTKLAISCCMKEALSDYPKGPLSSASKSSQQQMTRAEQEQEPAYLINTYPCPVFCILRISAVNVAAIVASSILFELIKAFITYNKDFPTVLGACFESVTC